MPPFGDPLPWSPVFAFSANSAHAANAVPLSRRTSTLPCQWDAPRRRPRPSCIASGSQDPRIQDEGPNPTVRWDFETPFLSWWVVGGGAIGSESHPSLPSGIRRRGRSTTTPFSYAAPPFSPSSSLRASSEPCNRVSPPVPPLDTGLKDSPEIQIQNFTRSSSFIGAGVIFYLFMPTPRPKQGTNVLRLPRPEQQANQPERQLNQSLSLSA